MRKFKFLFVIAILLIKISCINKKSNFEKMLDIEYKGQILKIYNDERNHNIYKYVIKKNDGQIIEDVGDHYSGSWEYASVGDSIIKKKGESFIMIKKNDGSSEAFETRIKE